MNRTAVILIAIGVLIMMTIPVLATFVIFLNSNYAFYFLSSISSFQKLYYQDISSLNNYASIKDLIPAATIFLISAFGAKEISAKIISLLLFLINYFLSLYIISNLLGGDVGSIFSYNSLDPERQSLVSLFSFLKSASVAAFVAVLASFFQTGNQTQE